MEIAAHDRQLLQAVCGSSIAERLGHGTPRPTRRRWPTSTAAQVDGGSLGDAGRSRQRSRDAVSAVPADFSPGIERAIGGIEPRGGLRSRPSASECRFVRISIHPPRRDSSNRSIHRASNPDALDPRARHHHHHHDNDPSPRGRQRSMATLASATAREPAHHRAHARVESQAPRHDRGDVGRAMDRQQPRVSSRGRRQRRLRRRWERRRRARARWNEKDPHRASAGPYAHPRTRHGRRYRSKQGITRLGSLLDCSFRAQALYVSSVPAQPALLSGSRLLFFFSLGASLCLYTSRAMNHERWWRVNGLDKRGRGGFHLAIERGGRGACFLLPSFLPSFSMYASQHFLRFREAWSVGSRRCANVFRHGLLDAITKHGLSRPTC